MLKNRPAFYRLAIDNAQRKYTEKVPHYRANIHDRHNRNKKYPEACLATDRKAAMIQRGANYDDKNVNSGERSIFFAFLF